MSPLATTPSAPHRATPARHTREFVDEARGGAIGGVSCDRRLKQGPFAESANQVVKAAAERGDDRALRLALPFVDLASHFFCGEGPLRWAVRGGSAGCVRALLAAGVDARGVCELGETALMIAARLGRRECVAVLLPVSDVNATDGCGLLALDHALRRGHRDCVALLSRATECGSASQAARRQMEACRARPSRLPGLDALLLELALRHSPGRELAARAIVVFGEAALPRAAAALARESLGEALAEAVGESGGDAVEEARPRRIDGDFGRLRPPAGPSRPARRL